MITEGHGYSMSSSGTVRAAKSNQTDKGHAHNLRTPEVLNRISNFESDTVAAIENHMSREAWMLAKEARLVKLRQELGWMRSSVNDGKQFGPGGRYSKQLRSVPARPSQAAVAGSPDFGEWRRPSNGSSASTISQMHNQTATAVKSETVHPAPQESIAPFREAAATSPLSYSPSPCNSNRGVTPSNDDLLLEGSRPAPGYEDIQRHINTLRGIKKIQPGMKSGSHRLTVIQPRADWEALAPVRDEARERYEAKPRHALDEEQEVEQEERRLEARRYQGSEEEAVRILHSPRRSEPLWKPKSSMVTLKLSDRSMDKSSEERSSRVLKSSVLELQTTVSPRTTKLPAICQVSPWDDDKKLLDVPPRCAVQETASPAKRKVVHHLSIVPPLQLPSPKERMEERSWTQRRMEQTDKFYPKIRFYMPQTARPSASATTEYCRKVLRFFPDQSSSIMQIMGQRSRRSDVQEPQTTRG
eukprot:764978-Hanusia_phi.AAC.4